MSRPSSPCSAAVSRCRGHRRPTATSSRETHAGGGLAGHREVAVLTGATTHEFNMAWIPRSWITADMAAEGLAKAGRPGAAGRHVPRPGRTATGRCRRAGRHRPDIPRPGPAAGGGQGGGGRPRLTARLPLTARNRLTWRPGVPLPRCPGSSSTRSVNRAWRTAQAPDPPGALAADMHGALVRS